MKVLEKVFGKRLGQSHPVFECLSFNSGTVPDLFPADDSPTETTRDS